MRRPIKEETLNAATHGIGFLLSVAATLWMGWRLGHIESLSTATTFACLVYGLSLMGLYLMSTLSHVFTKQPWHSRFRQLDQAFIYFLIVGTYSPLATMFLKTEIQWVLFGLLWAIAIFGFVSKIWFSHRVEHVSVAIYLLLGWAPAFIGVPLGDEAVRTAFYWLAAGGIIYSAGVVFLLQDKRVWYFHAIWHLFVISASAIHFYAIASYVLGDGS